MAIHSGMIMDAAEHLGEMVRQHLRRLSSNPTSERGRIRLRLREFTLVRSINHRTIQDVASEIRYLLDRWLESEHGQWVLEQIPGIQAIAIHDIAVNSLRLMIWADVAETTNMAYALRWS